jgi:CubicO group peptidase (beta-lactamase class C family)
LASSGLLALLACTGGAGRPVAAASALELTEVPAGDGQRGATPEAPEALEAPDDLGDLAAELLAGTGLPALALAVVVDGELAGLGAAGQRRLGAPAQVTAADRFHIGSCTKSMTATLAALLVQDGLLEWQTTVGEVFPELTYAPGGPGSAHSVTLAQLLTNRGGFATEVEPGLWAELWAEAGTPTEMRRRLVEACVAEPLPHGSGASFVYSNTGFAIAGAMLEELAGVPYEELLASRLFEPLGMTTAGFRAPATVGRVDQPYGHLERWGALVSIEPEPAGDNPRAIAPAGAVHLSAADLARYAQLHLGTGPVELLEPATLARLHTPPEGGTYAMGWGVTERAWAGGTALTHAGSNTMFFAVIWLAPEREFAAVALCNAGGDEAAELCDRAIARLVRGLLAPSG